jgi:hypothetical protein
MLFGHLGPKAAPQGLKPIVLGSFMYGLKPVPFTPYEHGVFPQPVKPVPFTPAEHFNKLLEHILQREL